MKFYKLGNSPAIDVVGTQFQSTEMKVFGDIQNEEIFRMDRIERNFKLPEPLLQKEAKPTSLMSVVPIPNRFLVIRKDFANFLDEFGIEDYQKWKIMVHHKSKIIDDYNLFYCPKTYENTIIDFSKSVFLITDGVLFPKKHKDEVTFQNFEEYIEKRREVKGAGSLYLHPKNLVLDFSHCTDGMIRLQNMPMAGTGYYVSERLTTAILEKGFTGMTFQEINEIDKRIKGVY